MQVTDRRQQRIDHVRRTVLWLLVSLLFSTFYILLQGYMFGGEDQSIHLPYLYRTIDRGFLNGDPFVDCIDHHPSFFWLAQGFVLRASGVSVELLYFLAHVFSVVSLMFGAILLYRSVFPGRVFGGSLVVFLVLLCLPHSSWGGLLHLIDPVFKNRSLSLGPLLVAVSFGIQRKYVLAFVVCGLVFLFHPLSAVHTILLLGGLVVVDGRHAGWRGWVIAPVLFFVVSSPLWVFIATHQSGGGIPWPPPDDWVVINRAMMYFHYFPSLWRVQHWISGGLCVSLLSGLWLGADSRHAKVLLGTAVAVSLLVFVGVDLLRIPRVLQLNLMQTWRMVSVVGLVVGAECFLRVHEQRKSVWSLAGISILLLGVGSANHWVALLGLLVALAGVLLRRSAGSAPTRWPSQLTAALLLSSALVASRAAVLYATPVEYLLQAERRTSFKMMQWVSQNLPKDALVVTPPYFFSDGANFRAIAQRRALLLLKDVGETTFSLELTSKWLERLEDVCRCKPLEDPEVQQGGASALGRVVDLAYDGFLTGDAAYFRTLQKKYGATHVLRDSTQLEANDQEKNISEFPLVYSDGTWRVFRIE